MKLKTKNKIVVIKLTVSTFCLLSIVYYFFNGSSMTNVGKVLLRIVNCGI